MVGADVTSAATRVHCPSSEAVVIDIRGTSVAAAWLMVSCLSGALVCSCRKRIREWDTSALSATLPHP
ncbi:MAG: hypothetical protein JWR85_25 [Marmoricola sp.]|nr:hypothetical protein [Marmoricola sp.]